MHVKSFARFSVAATTVPIAGFMIVLRIDHEKGELTRVPVECHSYLRFHSSSLSKR
jgi:hypothetical protein